MEKVQALAPLVLGKSKNTVSCQDPAAEPGLLISIRAAVTTFLSLGGCINISPLGGVVVRSPLESPSAPGSLAGTCALRTCS